MASPEASRPGVRRTPKRGQPEEAAPLPTKVGDKVEARWLNGAEWYPGRVTAVRLTTSREQSLGYGTRLFDVLYDDGEKESEVRSKCIRLAAPPADDAAATTTNGSPAQPDAPGPASSDELGESEKETARVIAHIASEPVVVPAPVDEAQPKPRKRAKHDKPPAEGKPTSTAKKPARRSTPPSGGRASAARPTTPASEKKPAKRKRATREWTPETADDALRASEAAFRAVEAKLVATQDGFNRLALLRLPVPTPYPVVPTPFFHGGVPPPPAGETAAPQFSLARIGAPLGGLAVRPVGFPPVGPPPPGSIGGPVLKAPTVSAPPPAAAASSVVRHLPGGTTTAGAPAAATSTRGATPSKAVEPVAPSGAAEAPAPAAAASSSSSSKPAASSSSSSSKAAA